MISCQQYDYIEIACLYRYEVSLTTGNGDVVQGTAVTTGINQHKQEYLALDTPQGAVNVLLIELTKMQVITANPHVSEVIFDDKL